MSRQQQSDGSAVWYLVEVTDDLIEQSDTLDAVSTDGVLSTELPELGNRREHHHDGVVRLVVQVLAHEVYDCLNMGHLSDPTRPDPPAHGPNPNQQQTKK